MFTISYVREGNKVRLQGEGNPPFSELRNFENDVQAQGFIPAVQTIESAISCVYEGKFAVAVLPKWIDVTTETPLSPQQRMIAES